MNKASRISPAPSRRGIGPADQCHAGTDDHYAGPSRRRYEFTEHEITEHGDQGISDCRSGLHVTEIGPRQHKQIGDEKDQQAPDAKPDGSIRKYFPERICQCTRRKVLDLSGLFHTPAEQDISQGTEEHHQSQQHVSFRTKPFWTHALGRRLRAYFQRSERTRRYSTASVYRRRRSRESHRASRTMRHTTRGRK